MNNNKRITATDVEESWGTAEDEMRKEITKIIKKFQHELDKKAVKSFLRHGR